MNTYIVNFLKGFVITEHGKRNFKKVISLILNKESEDISNLNRALTHRLTVDEQNIAVAQDTANTAKSIAKGAQQADVFDTYEDLVTKLNSASAKDYVIGKNFYIKEVKVGDVDIPDCWVSGLNNSAVQYAYRSETDFVNDLTRGVQVGFYTLNQLEGSKVDLSEFVPYPSDPQLGITDANRLVQSGFTGYVTTNTPENATGWGSLSVRRATTADGNGYTPVEQIFYSRAEADLGKIWTRIGFIDSNGQFNPMSWCQIAGDTTPVVKPDFEPIGWNPEDFVGQTLNNLNGKRFKLNNGVTIDRVGVIISDNFGPFILSWNGAIWTDGTDNLLSASLVSGNEYEFSDGISGPIFASFAVPLPVEGDVQIFDDAACTTYATGVKNPGDKIYARVNVPWGTSSWQAGSGDDNIAVAFVDDVYTINLYTWANATSQVAFVKNRVVECTVVRYAIDVTNYTKVFTSPYKGIAISSEPELPSTATEITVTTTQDNIDDVSEGTWCGNIMVDGVWDKVTCISVGNQILMALESYADVTIEGGRGYGTMFHIQNANHTIDAIEIFAEAKSA